MSKGKSAGGPSADAGKNPGNQMISPDNNIPAYKCRGNAL